MPTPPTQQLRDPQLSNADVRASLPRLPPIRVLYMMCTRRDMVSEVRCQRQDEHMLLYWPIVIVPVI